MVWNQPIVRGPADIDERGTLAVGTYTAGFFWQQPEDVNLQRGSEDSIQ